VAQYFTRTHTNPSLFAYHPHEGTWQTYFNIETGIPDYTHL